jgi:hypothetical protein
MFEISSRNPENSICPFLDGEISFDENDLSYNETETFLNVSLSSPEDAENETVCTYEIDEMLTGSRFDDYCTDTEDNNDLLNIVLKNNCYCPSINTSIQHSIKDKRGRRLNIINEQESIMSTCK